MSLKDQEKAKLLIIGLLEDMREASTAELINEAEMLGITECRDRVPSALATLASEGKIDKRISREKKAIIWTISENS
ncbi:MAG: hypothetical protein ACXAC8_19525 [Candidatus Hodarchaeales archaeon]|jgi:hypothetical protein